MTLADFFANFLPLCFIMFFNVLTFAQLVTKSKRSTQLIGNNKVMSNTVTADATNNQVGRAQVVAKKQRATRSVGMETKALVCIALILANFIQGWAIFLAIARLV